MDFDRLTIGRIASRIAGLIAPGILLLSILGGSWYTINQTERGVLLRNGAYVSTVEPGLHFKAPFFDTVQKIDVSQRTARWDKSGGTDYRQEAYTYDQQPATVSMTVMFHVPPGRVDDVYRLYKTEEGIEANLLNRRVPQDVKTIIGTYTAVRAIQDRAKLNADIFNAVKTDTEMSEAPIVIDGVQIGDVELSKAYIESVEAAMQARVEVQKREQQRDQQKIAAEITIINAKADAASRVAQATADATAVKARGEAEASAIRAKGDALRDNPQLVDLTRAERWNGVLPTTMLPSGTVPFLSAGK